MVAASIAGAARAQSSPVPERKLEPRWQVEFQPGSGRAFNAAHIRLRVQDDGRISFGLPLYDDYGHQSSTDDAQLLLMTIDGDGRVVGRVPVKGSAGHGYTAIPLSGGDFLVHVEEDETVLRMQFLRIAADGTERGAWKQSIDPSPASRLVDAVMHGDGLILAAVSIGIGPNDTLAIMVLGPDGRVVSDHRLRMLTIGSDYLTRIHRRGSGPPDPLFLILLNGPGRSPATQTSPYAIPLELEGGVITTALPIELGPEYALCSAMAREGHMVLGLSVPDSERGILRWLSESFGSDWKQAIEMQRPVPRFPDCSIGLREDGSGTFWLDPRTLLAFGADNELRWRATLDADAVGVSWMSDGDIVALHATDSGVRLVRYSPR